MLGLMRGGPLGAVLGYGAFNAAGAAMSVPLLPWLLDLAPLPLRDELPCAFWVWLHLPHDGMRVLHLLLVRYRRGELHGAVCSS